MEVFLSVGVEVGDFAQVDGAFALFGIGERIASQCGDGGGDFAEFQNQFAVAVVGFAGVGVAFDAEATGSP